MANGLKAEKLATILLDHQRVTRYFADSNFSVFLCLFFPDPRNIVPATIFSRNIYSTGKVRHKILTIRDSVFLAACTTAIITISLAFCALGLCLV